MERKKAAPNQSTLKHYLKGLFNFQARFVALCFACICVLVFAASVKFATDRFGRAICSQVSRHARTLVEAKMVAPYEAFLTKIKSQLIMDHEFHDITIESSKPAYGFRHYSLGACSLNWADSSHVELYSPTTWAGEEVFVKGIISPEFARNDLILFYAAICLFLTISYLAGRSYLISRINRKIAQPIEEICRGLGEGEKPQGLEIHEFEKLWKHLTQYQALDAIRTRMLIAKQYHHEVKSPANYLFFQLQRIASAKDEATRSQIVEESLRDGEVALSEMEKFLKKIATDDYARSPKPVDLAKMVLGKGASQPIFINGDKTLIKAIVQNLFSNARKACSDSGDIQASVEYVGDCVVLTVSNPVAWGVEIDVDRLFDPDYSKSARGTGLGLSLCRHLVELHHGEIEAHYDANGETFTAIVRFPRSAATV